MTPDQITNEMIAGALQNDGVRNMLAQLLKASGYDGALEDAPKEMLRPAIAAIVQHAQQQRQSADGNGDAADGGPGIPDEVVAQVFADPRADGMLRQVMAQANLEGDPADLPPPVKRQIVAFLVNEGAISFGSGPDAA